MIQIAVWSDLAIPTELDSIRIDVAGKKTNTKTITVATPQPGTQGPLVQPELVPGADKGATVPVTATAIRGGRDVVAQSARVTYVPVR